MKRAIVLTVWFAYLPVMLLGVVVALLHVALTSATERVNEFMERNKP